MWTRWCLGNRDPWVWAVFWLLEGKRKWSRPLLLGYWATLCIISVAGWSRQLARSRRYRHRNVAGGCDGTPAPFDPGRLSTGVGASISHYQGGLGGSGGQVLPQRESDPSAPPSPPSDLTGPLGLSFPNLPNLPNLPNGANVTNVATELLDAADKHVPTLSVNARRKYFHALAVVMFLPGVAVDVSQVYFFFLIFALSPSVCFTTYPSLRVIYSSCSFLGLLSLYELVGEKILRSVNCAARVLPFVIQCGLCLVHVRGICSLLCDLSVWCLCASVYERVLGFEG